MPHVTVHFDPRHVLQSVIDDLKPALQSMAAEHLSYITSDHRKVEVLLSEIYVRQQASHPTDVNPAIIEIEIQAGRKKERDPGAIVARMASAIRMSEIIPKELFDTPDICIWLRFSEDNAFELL